MMDINMTPLIDVMLVLLIMFIITIPVMTHAVKLDMPRASNAPSNVQPIVINLEIDFDGTVLWNGTPVTVRYGLNSTSQIGGPQAPNVSLADAMAAVRY